MKTLNVNVSANDFDRIQFSFEVDVNNVNQMVGVICNELFEKNNFWRSINSAATIKANEDVDVVVKVDDVVMLNTMQLRMANAIKLRFGNTFKSKHKFASTMYKLVLHFVEHELNVDINTDILLESLILRAKQAGEKI